MTLVHYYGENKGKKGEEVSYGEDVFVIEVIILDFVKQGTIYIAILQYNKKW